MSFWIGFLLGLFAAYALSIGVMACIAIGHHLDGLREKKIIERELERVQRIPRQAVDEVQFTHLTSIGTSVHGGDG